MISLFNMIGRFVWASSSDYIGRRNTYWIFFALGIVLYLSIPWVAHQVSVDPSVIWLVYFYAATMIIFTMYGGGFATIPAYLADMFGTRYVGGIHGRLLTAWSLAGVLGPEARSRCSASARSTLRFATSSARVDPERFRQAFGAGIEQLDALIAQQTVTIAKLMEIAPPGTVDPTPSLYNVAMYLMAALLAIALVANATDAARCYRTPHGGDRARAGAVKHDDDRATLDTCLRRARRNAAMRLRARGRAHCGRRPRRWRSSPSTRTSTSRSTMQRPTSIR